MGYPGDHALTAVIQAHPELGATAFDLIMYHEE